MPNVVDFGPLNQSVYDGRGMDPVISALHSLAAQAAAKKKQEDDLAFQREQEQRRTLSETDKTQHERMLEAAAMRKQQGIETVANNKGREAADARIRAAAGAGDFAEAQRAAGAYSEVDPATGEVRNGRPFSVNRPEGPPPPAPGSPRPLEEGPQATPDIAENAGTARALEDPNMTPESASVEMAKAEQERQRFAQANTPDAGSQVQQQGNQLIDPHTVAMARSAAWQQEQANPSVTIGGATTTPDEIRHSQSRAAGRDFEAVGQALQQHYAQAISTGDPVTIASAKRQLDAYQRVAPGVASGAISPSAATAQVAGAASSEARFEQNSTLADQRGDIGSALQTQRDAGALDRTKVTADAALARDAAKASAKTSSAGGADPKLVAGFERDVKSFQKDYNIPTDRKEEARMATLLNNKDNTIVQRAITGNLARGIASEKGVLTDKDISRLQGELGGVWGSVDQWLTRKDSGDLPPEILDKLTSAVGVVLAEKAQSKKQAEEAYMANLGSPDGTYSAQWGLGGHVKRKFKEIFGHDMPGAGATPAGNSPDAGDDPNGPNADAPLAEDPGAGEIAPIQVKGGRLPSASAAARTPVVGGRISHDDVKAELNRRRAARGEPPLP